MTVITRSGGDVSGLTRKRKRVVGTRTKTAGDYIGAIRRTKAYLDGYWSASANCFEISSDYPNTTHLADGTAWRSYDRDTWGNAWWMQAVAILAGYDAAHGTNFASATDKTRAITLADQFAGTTGAVWSASSGTWFHQMDGVDYKHTSLDASVAEALYYAYKYRTALGWTGSGPTAALSILTVDRACAIYSGLRTLSLNGTTMVDNQDFADWQFRRMAFAHLLGSTPADLDDIIKRFVDNMDRPYSAANSGSIQGELLYADFGWKYTEEYGPFPSWEYGAMSLGGALIFYPELESTLALSTTQKNRLKAWCRHIVGQWQLNGYPNWDTSHSNARLHSMAYWMHGAESLVAIARNDGYLNQNTGDAAIAKGILDNMIDTFQAMDTFRSDARDGAVAAWPIGVDVFSNFHPGEDATSNFAKWTFNAKFCALLAKAVDIGVADQAATHTKNIFTWHWDRQALHVATPNYSVGVLPYAPPIGTSYGGTETTNGSDAVQIQHWAPSHVQTPGNRWLTALGGYGSGHAFVAQVIRNGSTEIDTSTASPSARAVAVDGSALNLAPTSDTYSTDTSANYSVDAGSAPAISGGTLTAQSSASEQLWVWTSSTASVDRTATVKTHVNNAAAPAVKGVTARRIDASNFIVVQHNSNTVEITKKDGGSYTNLSNTVFTQVANGTDLWLRASFSGNTITARLYTSATGLTPLATTSYTLTGANAIKFGNVSSKLGLRWNGPTTSEYIDDLTDAVNSYYTGIIPTNFASSLQHTASGGGTNYSLTADSIFYPDRFETTYTVTKTGSAGTVSLNLEMPSRSGVTLSAHDGATRTDITTSGSVSTPVAIHHSYGTHGLVWKVSDLSGFTSSVQSQAVSSAVYGREVDRGRSAKLTLSAGTLSGSASVKVTGYITNGSTQQANHFTGIS